MKTAQVFERGHGIAPDVIAINRLHYEQLTRGSPGFRLVIVPASVLAHPRASLRVARCSWLAAAALEERAARDVAGCRCGGTDAAGL